MARSASTLDQGPDTLALPALLEAIALELGRMSADCRACEGDLAPLIAASTVEAATGLQALDHLTQRTEGLSGVVAALVSHVPSVTVSRTAVLGGLSLSGLARRLGGQRDWPTVQPEEFW